MNPAAPEFTLPEKLDLRGKDAKGEPSSSPAEQDGSKKVSETRHRSIEPRNGKQKPRTRHTSKGVGD